MAYNASTHDPVPFLGKTNQGNVLERGLPVPLDRTSLFDSLTDATAYARQGEDARELSGTSYPGQIITVLENSVATVYYIAPGHNYIQAEKDLDDAWYADTSENHSAFLTEHELESYTPVAASGTAIGEMIETRQLIPLASQNYVDVASSSAQASATMNWLDINGAEI